MSERQGKTILVADDDPSIRQAVQLKLSRAGYSVRLASDGEEALREAQEHRPDLVVVDYAMPFLDGFEVCRELRARPDLEDVPAVMLTAMEQDLDTDLAVELGIVEFFTKPFSPRELLARVDEILGAGESGGDRAR